MSTYNMQCPLAANRLIHSGLPATIEHKSKQQCVGLPSTFTAYCIHFHSSACTRL